MKKKSSACNTFKMDDAQQSGAAVPPRFLELDEDFFIGHAFKLKWRVHLLTHSAVIGGAMPTFSMLALDL